MWCDYKHLYCLQDEVLLPPSHHWLVLSYCELIDCVKDGRTSVFVLSSIIKTTINLSQPSVFVNIITQISMHHWWFPSLHFPLFWFLKRTFQYQNQSWGEFPASVDKSSGWVQTLLVSAPPLPIILNLDASPFSLQGNPRSYRVPSALRGACHSSECSCFTTQLSGGFNTSCNFVDFLACFKRSDICIWFAHRNRTDPLFRWLLRTTFKDKF